MVVVFTFRITIQAQKFLQTATINMLGLKLSNG